MVPIPFTSPSASINRVRIMDLPGLDIDTHIRGKQAYNLLSAPALAYLALEQAEELSIPDKLRNLPPESQVVRSQVPQLVSERFIHGTPSQRKIAGDLALQLGRNMAYIFLTIHRGDAVNRAARSDWTDEDWGYWANVRKLYVGGGLMSSAFGVAIIKHANALLKETSYTQLRILRSPWVQQMGILGASRYLPLETRCGLVLDLGQTSVKSAVVQFENNVIQHLTALPNTPVNWPWKNALYAGESIPPQEVLECTAKTIAKTHLIAQNNYPLQRDIMLCIAAYVRGGTLLGNGVYARMSLMGDDVRVLLTETLAKHDIPNVRLHLIHDGTAAAAVHAGEPNCAVWVIGTAIGVGFPEGNDKHLHKMPGITH